ncbi:DUF4845 domain-containing protein [Marilutibacter alkalisoli]|uniref:DUF4845 domain-containing protein n=1 Tax=Marilutibacter alkalisoli TaxID=2591633 RepID=A0A514BSY3_9GAMM|nr:DUF4845 domain-containing protein [Lysobacter alkalisoli]QDH70502.1 DUF4845 domain-containing protein [Lysobacter alkalisoli]
MKRTQGGMTLISFIIVLAVVGVFIYMGMKLIPMYSEYYAVKRALSEMSTDAAVEHADPAKIRDLFFRRLYISYSDNVGKEDFKIERKDAGYLITVDYEVRKPLIGNLDIVGRFNATQELRRRGG